jgi:hypothetical protein
MEDIKSANKEGFAVIGYHVRDTFVDSVNAFDTRYQYYRPGSASVPLSIIDGDSQYLGGSTNTYPSLLNYYNQATTRTPGVDLSLALEASNRIRVDVTNISGSTVQGTLHIVLVERFRPYAWQDLSVVDFICRTMMPGSNGQLITIAPSQKISSVQQFTLQADWNYCSIVAFVQTANKKISQGALMDLESTIPSIQMQNAPATGTLWLKGSTHTLAWSSSRPLSSVVLEYSKDGGATWSSTQAKALDTKTYQWTLPDVDASRCLLAIRDPYGGARAVSGVFAIGLSGDFNADGKVDSADRAILVAHLVENKAGLIPGADLNNDGVVDLFDLISFDAAQSR